MISCRQLFGRKKAGAEYPVDSSATRLSRGDPVGFPSHPCGWFSIIGYLLLNFSVRIIFQAARTRSAHDQVVNLPVNVACFLRRTNFGKGYKKKLAFHFIGRPFINRQFLVRSFRLETGCRMNLYNPYPLE